MANDERGQEEAGRRVLPLPPWIGGNEAGFQRYSDRKEEQTGETDSISR